MAWLRAMGGGGKAIYRWKKYRARLYLYKDGDECVSVTGGFTKTGYSQATTNNATITTDGKSFTISHSGGNGTGSIYGTSNLVNLNGYTQVCCMVNNDPTIYSAKITNFNPHYVGVGIYISDAGNLSTRIRTVLVKAGFAATDNLALPSSKTITVNRIWLDGGREYIEDVTSDDKNAYPYGYDESGEYLYVPVDPDKYLLFETGQGALVDFVAKANRANISGTGSPINYTAYAPVMELTKDTMKLQQGASSRSGTIYANQPIDLTKYSKVVIEQSAYVNSSSTKICIVSETDAATYTPVSYSETIWNETRYEFDISSLEGVYYIALAVWSVGSAAAPNGSRTISKIYLE